MDIYLQVVGWFTNFIRVGIYYQVKGTTQLTGSRRLIGWNGKMVFQLDGPRIKERKIFDGTVEKPGRGWTAGGSLGVLDLKKKMSLADAGDLEEA